MLNIIKNGFPSLTRQGLNSLSNLCLNVQAGLYGDACIAAMSIVAKCMQLMFSVCVGIGKVSNLSPHLITVLKNTNVSNKEFFLHGDFQV